jgi:hypothetical protein
MKKILLSSFILAVLAVVFTGCLKDKGFDDNQYGINDPDTQPPGVGFPLSTSAKYTIGLDAGVPTLQKINNVIFINIMGSSAPKSDVKVKIKMNDALRTAYNTANGANILAFPTTFYNIPSLDVVIPAGSMNGQVPINIPSTVPLDPSSSYGIGLTIESVDGGYKIAENMKNLFLEFTLKNKYDGNYRLDLNTKGWGAYGITDDNNFYTWPSNGDGTSIFLITGGPNAVRFFDDWGFGDFIQVCFTGAGATGASGFGATAPRFIFDNSTNALINVVNDIPPDSRNRQFRLNPAVAPPVGNYYDPATKKIYASYILSQTGRPDQFINAVLTYKSPRP